MTIIPNNTFTTSQVVGGVTQLFIFCQKHKILSWYRLTFTKLIDSYATVFNWNEPERQLIDKLILPHGKVLRGIFPLIWYTKFVFEHEVWLTKIPTQDRLKLLSVIYFKNMCIVTCDFESLKCIINGFGIAVSVFSYKKQQTWPLLVCVVLDCIDSWSLYPYLLYQMVT